MRAIFRRIRMPMPLNPPVVKAPSGPPVKVEPVPQVPYEAPPIPPTEL